MMEKEEKKVANPALVFCDVIEALFDDLRTEISFDSKIKSIIFCVILFSL